MKSAPSRVPVRIASICALAAVVFSAAPASAGAGVQVWVDTAWDVFPSYDDVVISLRADRSCYATVFVVDTEGYLHVIYPSPALGGARLRANATHSYRACDVGLDRLAGRGIAYVFAATSPVPFVFSRWGEGVFIGRYGYRVYGDPYVASGEFFASLLPTQRAWEDVAVGCARFYIGEWVRYPSYLCARGSGSHVRVGHCCRVCTADYARYRAHVADPADVMRPGGAIATARRASVIRPAKGGAHGRAVKEKMRPTGRVLSRTRVVSTSRTVRSSRLRASHTSARGTADVSVASRGDGTKRMISAEQRRATWRAASTSAKDEPTRRTATRSKTRGSKQQTGGTASGSASKAR